jgi:hypothetical protein
VFHPTSPEQMSFTLILASVASSRVPRMTLGDINRWRWTTKSGRGINLRFLAFGPSGTLCRGPANPHSGLWDWNLRTPSSSSPSSGPRRLHTLFLTVNHSPRSAPYALLPRPDLESSRTIRIFKM